MIKYLQLFILLLLSDALVYGFPLPQDGNKESHDWFLHLKELGIGNIKQDTDIILSKKMRTTLLKAFIAAPKDSFSIQIGAFKKKANAEKVSREIDNLSDIMVRIIKEKGFYKVRISGLPEIEKYEKTDSAHVSFKGMPLQQPPLTVESIIDSLLYSFNRPSTKTINGESQISIGISSDYDEGIPASDSEPWLKRIKYLGESFVLVRALVITILVSIGTMIALLIIILLNRGKIEMEEKRHSDLMEKYQNLIVDYLYGNATHQEFRSLATDNYSRQVLIDQMIDMSINLIGEDDKKILALYKHLGLDKDSLARAYDRRWHKKIKGFRELAFMDIKDANDKMYKALNSSNEILRMEAQIALVRLNPENPFEFLSHLKRPFSLWEQITLHDLIIQHNLPLPEFKKWLTSPNDTVVLFALRMIKEFNQTDAEEGINNALVHKSAEVRLLAVRVAGDLGLYSSLEIFKRMYKNEDFKTCLEIIRSIGKMPDTSMLGFLKLILDKEDDVQLQIEATKSIEKMGEEGVKELVKIMKSEYKNYKIIVRHVLDKRIN